MGLLHFKVSNNFSIKLDSILKINNMKKCYLNLSYNIVNNLNYFN